MERRQWLALGAAFGAGLLAAALAANFNLGRAVDPASSAQAQAGKALLLSSVAGLSLSEQHGVACSQHAEGLAPSQHFHDVGSRPTPPTV